tara:strand:+ start:3892 stop:5772 length:1881 start_codon:yes stop_codon:yes gene_type:complete
MKSFDKFQFDSSPLIDEEMEDLDESLVGAVRSAGQVVGNRLKDTGKALQRAQKKASTLTSRAASKVQSVAKNLNKKIENISNRDKFTSTKTIDPFKRGVAPKRPPDPKANTLLNKSGSFTGLKKPNLSQRSLDNKADAISGARAKGILPKKYEGDTTKASQFRDLTRGGLRSSLARTIGSGALNVYKGLAQKPQTMVSSDQPGTGYQGAFQGLGNNVQSAAKGVANTKRFQPTTSQKVGYNPKGTPTKTTPGKEDGRTVGSTLLNKGLNAITNQRDSVSSKKKPQDTPEPTGSARLTQSKRTKIKDSDTLKFKPTAKEITQGIRSKNRREVAQKISNILGNAKDPQSRQVKKQIRLAKKDLGAKQQARTDFKADEADRAKENLLNKIKTGTTKDGSNASDVAKETAKKTGVRNLFKPITRDKTKPQPKSTLDDDALKYIQNNPDKIDNMLIKARSSDKKKEQELVDKEDAKVTSSQSTGTGNRGGQRTFKNFNRPIVTRSRNNKGGQTAKNNISNQSKPSSKPKVTSSQTTGTGNKGGQTKKNNAMQQYINDLNQDDQNSKNKKNNRFSNNRPIRDEFEFSHWREEFLWEVDKKYPEKIKEIKPMTGKNTITVNPEDKGAKYKRGY